MIRTFTELTQLSTFKERFEYLKLNGNVGADTFGFDRYLNQIFYRSKEWKSIRNKVIIRDNGCDLGLEGYDIYGQILIHHMNPISVDDIINRRDYILNSDFLICTSFQTHNAIHYSDLSQLAISPVERSQNDTCPWRKS